MLAELYAAALRYRGAPARVQRMPDPVAGLDSGEVAVVPGFTGRLLQRFAPGATAIEDEDVYRAMVAALPEGIAAGDYASAAEDKPAVAVAKPTADAWRGRDLTTLVRHCSQLTTGSVVGTQPPAQVGSCKLPAPRVFPTDAALFDALERRPDQRGLDQHRGPRNPRRRRGARRQGPAVGAGRERGAAVPAQRTVRVRSAGAQRDRRASSTPMPWQTCVAKWRREPTRGRSPTAWLAAHPLGR